MDLQQPKSMQLNQLGLKRLRHLILSMDKFTTDAHFKFDHTTNIAARDYDII